MSKARKIRDIVAKTGEYTDKNGNKKGRYVNAGSLFYNDEEKSFFIILNRTFNPAGVPNLSDKGEADSVFLSCFKPERNNNSGDSTSGHQSPSNNYASASGGSYGYDSASTSHQRLADDGDDGSDIPF